MVRRLKGPLWWSMNHSSEFHKALAGQPWFFSDGNMDVGWHGELIVRWQTKVESLLFGPSWTIQSSPLFATEKIGRKMLWLRGGVWDSVPFPCLCTSTAHTRLCPVPPSGSVSPEALRPPTKAASTGSTVAGGRIKPGPWIGDQCPQTVLMVTVLGDWFAMIVPV